MGTVITVGGCWVKVKFIWEGGYADQYYDEVLELPDASTDVDIQQEWYKWSADFVQGKWERLDD